MEIQKKYLSKIKKVLIFLPPPLSDIAVKI